MTREYYLLIYFHKQERSHRDAHFHRRFEFLPSRSDVSIDDAFDGGGSIEAWFNVASDGEANAGVIALKFSTGVGWILSTQGESGGFVKLNWNQQASTDGAWSNTNADISLNELHHIVAYYNNDSVSNDPIFIIDGIKYTVGNGLTETATPVGSRVSEAGANFMIANEPDGNWAIDGSIFNVKLSDKIRPSSHAITSYNAQKADSDMLTVSGTTTKRYEKNQTGIKAKQVVDNKEFINDGDEWTEVI